MSEEKLYMVKNNEGSYITVTNGWLVHWHENSGDLFSSYQEASKWATTLDGHVVTFVEEPKKVVLTEEQAEIVDDAHGAMWPATYISGLEDSGEQKLLIEAYVNGYTVEKEKKYRVLTPKSWWASANDPEYMHMGLHSGIGTYAGIGTDVGADDDAVFTQKQLDLYDLNGAPFTKEEVTDDEV
ncbi:DUF1642 domain-containing protein [Lacticaseibacillus paracasei]|uniref:DUF1642 domain-containing protein n=1 Tax=Lacticaseibacillus paracasei TaxID=1597 RepID=UPI0034E8758F